MRSRHFIDCHSCVIVNRFRRLLFLLFYLAPSIDCSLQVMSVTASQHAEVLDRLESLNLLRDSNRLLREEHTSLVDKVCTTQHH